MIAEQTADLPAEEGSKSYPFVLEITHRPTGFQVRDQLDMILLSHLITNEGPAIGLLRVLADHVLADKPDNPRYGYVNGQFTKHAILARLTGTSEKTVQRNLRRLENWGWIARYPRYFSNGERGPDDIALMFLCWVKSSEGGPVNQGGTPLSDPTPPPQMTPPLRSDREDPSSPDDQAVEEGFKEGSKKTSKNRAERGRVDEPDEGPDHPPILTDRPPEGAEAVTWYQWICDDIQLKRYRLSDIRHSRPRDGNRTRWLSEAEHLAALAELEASA